MSSPLSTIGALFEALQERANEVSPDSTKKHSLVVLLITSFLDAMEEIRLGADFEQFQDLAVLNLIIHGAEEGYSTEELKKFVMSLKRNLE